MAEKANRQSIPLSRLRYLRAGLGEGPEHMSYEEPLKGAPCRRMGDRYM